MGATLTTVYCDGWDDGVVNPLTRDIAEARHAGGEPYSVVLLAGGRAHAVVDVALGDGYLGLTRFDGYGGRASRHQWRRSRTGDLFLREARRWQGTTTTTVSFELNGRRTDFVERGNSSAKDFTPDSPAPRLAVPAFGQWQALLEFAGDGRPEIVDASSHPLPVRAGVRPWQPPRPLRPYRIEELFADGAERPVRDRTTRISTHAAGPLHLPSGRLVAADPSSLDYGEEPFTVTVAPGGYPVTISVATFADDPGHRRVAAARLQITDSPTATWELALRDGQDRLDLGDGEFFGFGVDAGLGCFVDEDNRERLSEEWERFDFDRFTTLAEGGMVAWSSGWGDGAYPTWIGRNSSGAVTCFVADMLLFGAGT
ncbi:DUF4241 domain-containing protein [Actinoplanes sp. NPDC048967]|uniref:DUF4241 domain-containing protein n=1 Tax=Actinoplanes sp. NPDC048967 TaxID=3155269 RepID=UPI0033F1EDF3